MIYMRDHGYVSKQCLITMFKNNVLYSSPPDDGGCLFFAQSIYMYTIKIHTVLQNSTIGRSRVAKSPAAVIEKRSRWKRNGPIYLTLCQGQR